MRYEVTFRFSRDIDCDSSCDPKASRTGLRFGLLGSAIACSVLSLGCCQSAFANGIATAENIHLGVDSLNGILCTPECGRFFREGREQFEQEIQTIEEGLNQPEDATPLRIDPELPQKREQWQQGIEQGIENT
ncbi:MAG: hypothetical protein AAFR12_14675 [Cyanobacteria bacterium J06626_6]